MSSSSGSETLPRSRARRNLLATQSDTTSTTTSTESSLITGKQQSYLRADHTESRSHSPSSKDKAFVVLQDDNNNDYSGREEPTPNRWLRGSLRDRAEPWSPSWALNPNTKEVPTI